MKKLGIIVFVVAVAIGVVFANCFSFGRMGQGLFNVSVNFNGVKGSGNVTSEKRDVSGFDSVDVSGVFQVEITSGKDFSVEVQADDNLLPLISTDISGNTLKIQMDKKVETKNGIIVRISAPNIESIEASGVAKVNAADIKNESLSIDSSGASRVVVTGETSELKIDVSGATNVDAQNLKAANANVDAGGASRVQVNVANELHAEASGASRIVYSGDPRSVDNHQSGAGSVSRK